jgi:hypothetical protein
MIPPPCPKEDYPPKKRNSVWKNVARTALWGLILSSAVLLSQKIQRHQNQQIPEAEKKELSRKLSSFWALQKSKTYHINQLAQKYIQEKKLPPGHPLPPKTFYKKDDPLRALLSKNQAMQITSEYRASSRNYSIGAISLLTVLDKVPKPPERYAYCGVLWNQQITGTSYQMYPNDPFSTQRLLQAQKEVERKMHQLPPHASPH